MFFNEHNNVLSHKLGVEDCLNNARLLRMLSFLSSLSSSIEILYIEVKENKFTTNPFLDVVLVEEVLLLQVVFVHAQM